MCCSPQASPYCKSKIAQCVQRHTRFTSLLFQKPSILIWLFQNLTFKIQTQVMGKVKGQGHSGSKNLIPFVPCQSAVQFLRYGCFTIWSWMSKVKIVAQGCIVGSASYRLTSLSFHINWPSHFWDTVFKKFDLENPRSRSQVRSKLKVAKWVWPTSYRLTSLSIHVNWRPHSRDTAFSKFDLDIWH